MTATADVITLPVAEQSVADLLDDMAGRDAALWEVMPYAHGDQRDLDEIALAWEDFREAVRMRDGLGTGLIHWSEFEPELTCSEKQETAFQLAAEQADYARNVIQHGHQFGGN
jgi:hypothetical protein